MPVEQMRAHQRFHLSVPPKKKYLCMCMNVFQETATESLNQRIEEDGYLLLRGTIHIYLQVINSYSSDNS